MRILLALAYVIALPLLAPAQTLYKTTLIQAAPGKLLELIDLEKQIAAQSQSIGDAAPLWMRHTQGDRWDLLLLSPIGTYSDYYRPERAAKRDQLQQRFHDALDRDIAWQQDIFVTGPPPEALHKSCDGAGFFHVEMFQSLPGKRDQLIHQREMENAYSRQIHAPENLIFVRDQGADVDSFTIGCYPDLKHYAQSSDVPPADADRAAKAAGFESAAHIGPYLRTLIALHHDTLAVAIK